MRLKTDIPQIIPMCGKRIRVYHKGIQKLCTNCFGAHQRRNCRSSKVPWIKYVLNFMEKYPDIPEELYGRWWKAVNDEFGEIVKDDPKETTNDNYKTYANNIDAQEERQSQHTDIPRQTGTRQKSSSSLPQTTMSHHSEPQQSTLSHQEEENLSDYLDLGLSITEAREQFEIEKRAAEIRLKIRDNKRNQSRGSVEATRRTAIGMTSSRGRGGLSFN